MFSKSKYEAAHLCASYSYRDALDEARMTYLLKKSEFSDHFSKVTEKCFRFESEGHVRAIKLWDQRVKDIRDKYVHKRTILPLSVYLLARDYAVVSTVLCKAFLPCHEEHAKLSPELYTLLDSVSSEGLFILDHLFQLEVANIKIWDSGEVEKMRLAGDGFAHMAERLQRLVLGSRVGPRS
ncbi:hypothetical protein I350_04032 [Cryptococcus amylolentus CBS 6273]|uniref:Uncharacterized protein n=1 Tax=Cryptococcus amylolentus CBS 6273 TaxID=1296118 RepID=A0A1E3K0M8_9TREE|nr:hypothetical protein I350_04032 [Cryptococcus amylolentus CBS 6273]